MKKNNMLDFFNYMRKEYNYSFDFVFYNIDSIKECGKNLIDEYGNTIYISRNMFIEYEKKIDCRVIIDEKRLFFF